MSRSTNYEARAPSAHFPVQMWHMEENSALPLLKAVLKPGETLHNVAFKKIVTADERGLGEITTVTFIYIYKQNLMNSFSITVLIPSPVQQPVHIVERASLRLHGCKGL